MNEENNAAFHWTFNFLSSLTATLKLFSAQIISAAIFLLHASINPLYQGLPY